MNSFTGLNDDVNDNEFVKEKLSICFTMRLIKQLQGYSTASNKCYCIDKVAGYIAFLLLRSGSLKQKIQDNRRVKVKQFRK